ncbi:MAG: MarR family transcriptional regulator [Marmoricola sp.]
MRNARARLAADAWGAVLQAHAELVPYLDRQLQAAVGLPLTWYDVLLELAAAPGGRLRMSDLADRVVLSRTRVSRLVDELAAGGLLSREQNPDDRRSAYAVLTPLGRARQKAAAPVYLRGITEHFADSLSDDELRTITRALGRAVAARTEASRT